MLIKEGESLREYIDKIISPSWRQRDFVDSVKMYWKSNMECVLGLSGLRGLGKTIGLLQSLPDTKDALYICAQRRGDEFLDSADSILNVIEKYSKSCKNIIIDEYTWISDREKLDSSLFFYIQNGYRIAITGTESMTLELLNHGALAHRVFMLHCNYFSYEEYLKLNNIEDPDEKTLDNYLRTGGIFKEYAIDNFDSMKSYIKDGIIDSLVLYLKNIPVEKATAIIYDIFYKAVCPEPSGDGNPVSIPGEPMDLFRFHNILGISPETVYDRLDFARAVDILIKIGLVIEVKNLDDKNANKHRYYIVNPSLNYQLFQAIYGREEPSSLLGAVFEATCVAHFSAQKDLNDELYFLKGNKLTSKELAIDFIIADKNCEPHNSKFAYFFECKHKAGIGLHRGVSIESPEIMKYFPRAYSTGRYVLYRGNECFAFLDNEKFIFAPLNSKLPQRYKYFDEQIEALRDKGAIYPKTLSNPYYSEHLKDNDMEKPIDQDEIDDDYIRSVYEAKPESINYPFYEIKEYIDYDAIKRNPDNINAILDEAIDKIGNRDDI